MLPGLRIIKRVLLVAVFSGLIIGLFIVYKNLTPQPTPTPTPDPRASLKPLHIVSVDVFKVKDGDYDILARIQNPNQEFGSGNVQYVLNAEGLQVHTGSFYILPGETKYIVISPVSSVRELHRASMTIVSIDWQELDALALQGVNFVVTNTVFSKKPELNISARMRGFVANNSNFDVNRVDVAVILFDADEHPIAVNRTELHTFLAHTTRGFEASWSSPFSGDIARTYVEAHANLFEQSSFMRTYGGQELFQSF